MLSHTKGCTKCDSVRASVLDLHRSHSSVVFGRQTRCPCLTADVAYLWAWEANTQMAGQMSMRSCTAIMLFFRGHIYSQHCKSMRVVQPPECPHSAARVIEGRSFQDARHKKCWDSVLCRYSCSVPMALNVQANALRICKMFDFDV